ncbi:MAG: phage tail protein [Bacilli bacterium]|nr:phage tail protein [Bacilli bacterium]
MSDLLLKMPLNYEPLRKNRWLLRFPADLGIQEWWLESASRPNIIQNETEIPFLNTSTYVVGRYHWETIQVKLRDPIGPSASQAIMEWIRLHSESITGRQGYAAGYKRDIELEMLDPTGVVVQKWILKNAMCTTANFDDLNYSTDDLASITITLRYDYAILCY